MVNADQMTEPAERVQVLSRFLTKMRDSGYESSTRMKIVKAGLAKYYRMLRAEITGVARLHRYKEEFKLTRSVKALKNKKWFGRCRGGNRVRTALNNPYHVPLKRNEIKEYNNNRKSKMSTNTHTHGNTPHRDLSTHGATQQATDDPTVEGAAAGPRPTYAQDPPNKISESKNNELVTETVIFVPHTQESKLMSDLQAVNNRFARLHNQPRIKFVESRRYNN